MMAVHAASDAFVGTVAQAVTFWHIYTSKVEVVGWIYHFSGQQQFGFCSYCVSSTYICLFNLFSCNGAVVLRTCWRVTIMVAITIIVIINWHWCLDTFNGLTMLIIALSVMLSICSCVTRTMQFSGSTSLVPEVLCTFRHQLYGKVTSLLLYFCPHQGQPLVQGLIIVMTLVTNMVSFCGTLRTPKIGGNQCCPGLSLSQWVLLPLAGSVNNLIVR
jgi:hypothetical protein